MQRRGDAGREPFPRASTISRWQTIPHGLIDRSLARSLARSRLRVKETPRARCTHGTHETRVRSPRSRARHWRAVAPGLLVRGATEQRRDARRHPHPSAKGAATSHPAVRRNAPGPGSGPHWMRAPLDVPPSVDDARDRYPRRTYCQSKEREITSADKGCQSALSVL